jgi:recombination protein RecR
MIEYPDYLTELIDALAMFPGVGPKSASRMAFQLIEMDDFNRNKISQAINTLSGSIQYCQKCANLSSDTLCSICQDNQRSQSTICVVSNYKDIYSIEKMDAYNGVYHVLNGDIMINKGITPDKLNIQSLLDRLNDNTDEIIIATNPTIEGETTALYLSKVLADYDVKVTRIANGMPMGSNIDYVDHLTILKAFQNRQDFNNK